MLDAVDHRGGLSEVAWSAAFETRRALGGNEQLWLNLKATARLPLCCQRCLDVMSHPLSLDVWFRFVLTEVEALAEDDGCEEDLLALETPLVLAALLEDELLMALPLVAAHDVCPIAPVLSVADPDFPTEPVAVNPFHALLGLKKPQSGR